MKLIRDLTQKAREKITGWLIETPFYPLTIFEPSIRKLKRVRNWVVFVEAPTEEALMYQVNYYVEQGYVPREVFVDQTEFFRNFRAVLLWHSLPQLSPLEVKHLKIHFNKQKRNRGEEVE